MPTTVFAVVQEGVERKAWAKEGRRVYQDELMKARTAMSFGNGAWSGFRTGAPHEGASLFFNLKALQGRIMEGAGAESRSGGSLSRWCQNNWKDWCRWAHQGLGFQDSWMDKVPMAGIG